ncbi:MAG: hypothetical protein AAF467_02895 [Actinomycetota bacterium]
MGQLGTQLLGLFFIVMPLVAIRWNLAGKAKRRKDRPNLLAPEGGGNRWRLEVYSNADDVKPAFVRPADVPFPVKTVESAKAAQARFAPDKAWTLPRMELDVEVADPFTTEVFAGLLGHEHNVRLVTGNEAVVDASSLRLRIRRFRFS